MEEFLCFFLCLIGVIGKVRWKEFRGWEWFVIIVSGSFSAVLWCGFGYLNRWGSGRVLDVLLLWVDGTLIFGAWDGIGM